MLKTVSAQYFTFSEPPDLFTPATYAATECPFHEEIWKAKVVIDRIPVQQTVMTFGSGSRLVPGMN